jgi:hypothetical protein
MGAANGSMYVASYNNLVVQNATQDLIQIYTNTYDNSSLIIHSWKLTCFPLQISGVAQDDRMTLQVVQRSVVSGPSFGQIQIPMSITPLNPASGNGFATVNTNNNSVGTLSAILGSYSVSVIKPWNMVYRENQRIIAIPDSPGAQQPVCLYLAVPPSTWYLMSFEILYEEIGT